MRINTFVIFLIILLKGNKIMVNFSQPIMALYKLVQTQTQKKQKFIKLSLLKHQKIPISLNYLKIQPKKQQMKTIPKSVSATLSTQESDQIRLQRLIQQRKRMQYMSSLILQQKDSISLLKQQNHELSQSYTDLKLQNQLLKDKLDVSAKYNQNISQVLVKQSSLLQSFRQLLLGTNLHISQQQRQILLQQIQICYQKWQGFNLTQSLPTHVGFKYPERQESYSAFDKQAAQQIARLTDQNQQLNEKYQQLCKNYLELSKDLKLKQLQISNLIGDKNHHKNHKDHNCGHIRQKKQRTPSKSHNRSSQTNNPDQIIFYQHIIKEKQSQILLLAQQIEKLKIQEQKKDKLIKQHRKNQKQQKKLLHSLRTKFNLEGKQLSQIASHNRIKSTLHFDPSPSKVQLYPQVDKSNIQSSTKKKTQTSPLKERSFDFKYASDKKYEQLQKIDEPNSSGFKRTLIKNPGDL